MQTWYLMYNGSSQDGQGNAPFVGRTVDKKIAKELYKKIISNPYSIGFINYITDDKCVRVTRDTNWEKL